MPLDLLPLLQVIGGVVEALAPFAHAKRWQRQVSLSLAELEQALAERVRQSAGGAPSLPPPRLLEAAARFRSVVDRPLRAGTPQHLALQALAARITDAVGELAHDPWASGCESELVALVAEALRIQSLGQSTGERAGSAE